MLLKVFFLILIMAGNTWPDTEDSLNELSELEKEIIANLDFYLEYDLADEIEYLEDEMMDKIEDREEENE